MPSIFEHLSRAPQNQATEMACWWFRNPAKSAVQVGRMSHDLSIRFLYTSQVVLDSLDFWSFKEILTRIMSFSNLEMVYWIQRHPPKCYAAFPPKNAGPKGLYINHLLVHQLGRLFGFCLILNHHVKGGGLFGRDEMCPLPETSSSLLKQIHASGWKKNISLPKYQLFEGYTP